MHERNTHADHWNSAIVVGGAGGLGEATVRRLHGAGANVVVDDMADDKGKALECQVPYSAAKGGVIGMTLVAARALSPMGIRVISGALGGA